MCAFLHPSTPFGSPGGSAQVGDGQVASGDQVVDEQLLAALHRWLRQHAPQGPAREPAGGGGGGAPRRTDNTIFYRIYQSHIHAEWVAFLCLFIARRRAEFGMRPPALDAGGDGDDVPRPHSRHHERRRCPYPAPARPRQLMSPVSNGGAVVKSNRIHYTGFNSALFFMRLSKVNDGQIKPSGLTRYLLPLPQLCFFFHQNPPLPKGSLNEDPLTHSPHPHSF